MLDVVIVQSVFCYFMLYLMRCHHGLLGLYSCFQKFIGVSSFSPFGVGKEYSPYNSKGWSNLSSSQTSFSCLSLHCL